MFGFNEGGLEVNLGQEVNVVTRPVETKTVEAVTIERMVDMPADKRVFVYTHEVGELVLWEGADYDAVGQWTDQDVINRVKALLTSL